LPPTRPIGCNGARRPPPPLSINPSTVASPTQIRAILAQVVFVRPDLVAFFGCLYYAALRPEEAVALRRSDLILPAHGRGKMILTNACPRTGTAWTSTGRPHEARGLKHRPDGTIRVVPIPPVLVAMLRSHLRESGTAPDGRLFRGTRSAMLSESVYGRAWHTARQAALGPELAATTLARRPYDLRHYADGWVMCPAVAFPLAGAGGPRVAVRIILLGLGSAAQRVEPAEQGRV
jgi:integrase